MMGLAGTCRSSNQFSQYDFLTNYEMIASENDRVFRFEIASIERLSQNQLFTKTTDDPSYSDNAIKYTEEDGEIDFMI